MKYYFIISGELRSYFTVLFQYLSQLSELLDLKILIHTINSSSDSKLNIREESSDYKNTSFSYKNEKFTQREINTVYQWYNIYSCFQLLNNIVINDDDILIRIRPDIKMLLTPLDFYKKIKEVEMFNGITIPIGNDIFNSSYKKYSNNTLNDQFAIGKYKYMKIYCNLYNNINFNSELQPIISESILYTYLLNNSIKIQRIQIDYSLCNKKCNLISISGDSGVGKTTLANAFCKTFSNNSMILETDRYHKWERTSHNWLTMTHLNPNANYIERMLDDTYLLQLGENIYQLDYDHSTGKFTEVDLIKPTENIFLCGLHLLSSIEQRSLIKLKIFIDVEISLKKEWKINRDIKKRGYTFDKANEIFIEREKDYIKFILPQKDYADIIINYSKCLTNNIECIVEINKSYNNDIYTFLKNVSIESSSNNEKKIYKLKNLSNEELLQYIIPADCGVKAQSSFKTTCSDGHVDSELSSSFSYIVLLQYLIYIIM